MCNVTFIYLSRALLPSRAMVAKQEQVKRTKGISLKKMIKTTHWVAVGLNAWCSCLVCQEDQFCLSWEWVTASVAHKCFAPVYGDSVDNEAGLVAGWPIGQVVGQHVSSLIPPIYWKGATVVDKQAQEFENEHDERHVAQAWTSWLRDVENEEGGQAHQGLGIDQGLEVVGQHPTSGLDK